MKHINYYQFTMFLVFLPSMIHSSCTAPTSGERIWDIAADNVLITCSIESKVSALEGVIFPTDFAGTFTVLQALLSLVCTIESKAEQLETSIDLLFSQVSNDVSKVNHIEEHVVDISSEVEQIALDVDEIFTALDGLKNTISSKIDLLNVDLLELDNEMLLIIQAGIADGITIASRLDAVSQEVVSINSLLDIINIESQLDISSSLINMLVQSYNTLESNVDQLGAIISTGFAGTFTALESNLMLACSIESLVDALSVMDPDIDPLYSVLAQLQATVSTIDDQVDTISAGLVTINSEIDLLEPKFILIDSKLVPIASQTSILADDTTSIGQLLAQDVLLLNKDNSILDEVSQNTLSSLISVIESSIEIIETELVAQNSSLSEISSELALDASKVCAIVMNDEAAISKLSVANSQLDVEFQQALTIESLIDITINFANSIDEVTSKSQLVSSDLDLIEIELVTISSKLDLLNDTFSIIDTTLDNITATAVNNLIGTITIESKVANIVIDQSAADLLTSKLAVIEDEVCTISSKMVIVDSIIPELITTAQGLAVDFQETWTILDSISNILAADQSALQVISSNTKLSAFDYSGVYTTINSIIAQKLTVDSQVDVADSLVDLTSNLIRTGFDGIFSALDQASMTTINSQVDKIDTEVNTLNAYWGTPINQPAVGTTGYLITTPGRYYVAENIVYSGATNAAITISASDVFLDLNEHVLERTGGQQFGVFISTTTNVQIVNGRITGFGRNITASNGSSNIIIRDVLNGGVTVVNNFVENLIIKDSSFDNSANDPIPNRSSSVSLHGCKNTTIVNSEFNFSTVTLTGHGGIEVTPGTPNVIPANIYVANCSFMRQMIPVGSSDFASGMQMRNTNRNTIFKRNFVVGGPYGFSSNAVTGGEYVLDNVIINAGFSGVRYGNGLSVIMGNSITQCLFRGIVPRSGGSTNNYIAFNSLVNNGRNIEVTASSTILGNFAFNANAVGNPNNTNYTVSGANITNKFITVTQTATSKLPALSGEWYNMNMLP